MTRRDTESVAEKMNETNTRRAVVLVSGGLDSTTVLAMARAQGYACYTLSFDYGQRHRAELVAAERVSTTLGDVQHKVVNLNLDSIGGSALTDVNIAVPETATEGIPVTYVPARNTVFLSITLGWAEVLGAHDIFIGVNAVDYSGYPDCRPGILRAFEAMAAAATAAGAERGARFTVHGPLMELSKGGIVRRAAELDVNLGLTHTCYDPIQREGITLACGACDACILRLKGFREAGAVDPIPYAAR